LSRKPYTLAGFEPWMADEMTTLPRHHGEYQAFYFYFYDLFLVFFKVSVFDEVFGQRF
jgi:hypothetical protein